MQIIYVNIFFFFKFHLIFEQQFCSTVVEQVKKFGIPLLTWISVWKITSKKVDREQSKAHTESREFCTFGAPHNIFRLTATPAVWPIPFEHQLPCYLRSPFYVLVEGLVANLQTQFAVLRVLLDSLCSHLTTTNMDGQLWAWAVSVYEHWARTASGERSNNSFFNVGSHWWGDMGLKPVRSSIGGPQDEAWRHPYHMLGCWLTIGRQSH